MRETDLLAFEIGRKEAQRGRGDVLLQQGEWRLGLREQLPAERCAEEGLGFKGFVMSDWGGTHSTVKAALAGLDKEDARQQLTSATR